MPRQKSAKSRAKEFFDWYEPGKIRLISRIVEKVYQSRPGDSVEELAAWIGVCPGTLYKFNSGETVYPRLDTLCKFGRAIGLDVTEILEGEWGRTPPSKKPVAMPAARGVVSGIPSKAAKQSASSRPQGAWGRSK